MREYQIVSPSLDGILHHESVVYDGIHRPEALLRVMDRPRSTKHHLESVYNEQEQKIINQYFNDIYVVFMKKVSLFVTESDIKPDDELKLLALLQEMIKVKKIVAKISAL